MLLRSLASKVAAAGGAGGRVLSRRWKVCRVDSGEDSSVQGSGEDSGVDCRVGVANVDFSMVF